MNKLLIAAASGVLFSLIIAFAIIYFTASYANIPSSETRLPSHHNHNNNYTTTFIYDAPVYVINNISIRSPYAVFALVNSTVNGLFVDTVNAPAYSINNESYSYNEIFSNKSEKTNVFFIEPNYISTRPNSSISFYLYFNMSYYNLYNDSIYSDEIGNYVSNFTIVQLNQTSSGFYIYKVTMHVGNLKPNTLILLPVWDTHFLEIQYIIILID